MQSYRNLIIVVLTLLLVGGGLAIWDADRKAAETESTTTTDTTEGPEMVGQNVSFVVTQGEVKKWKIDAAKAIYSEDRTEANLTNVKGEFYDAEGKTVLTFSAPTGHYTGKGNLVQLKGGVVAKSTREDGGKLEAPTMSWGGKSDMAVASGGAKMTFPQGVSEAETCRFTLDFSRVLLEGGVSSAIAP